MVFFGHHTKHKKFATKNTVGCGCLGNHNPNDMQCFYSVIKAYYNAKRASDRLFVQNMGKRLSLKQRKQCSSCLSLKVFGCKFESLKVFVLKQNENNISSRVCKKIFIILI